MIEDITGSVVDIDIPDEDGFDELLNGYLAFFSVYFNRKVIKQLMVKKLL